MNKDIMIEKIVDLIAEVEPISADDIAKHLNCSIQYIRKELNNLKKLGLILKTENENHIVWRLA